ncbi:polysaccharide biosynthesis protein [Propionimicrobium sp. PCR01-08-3]|uniref:polysaccharide biosynthesis protein n=1 Tax=Propionimicrobium sp. PCR01-08-3 TaxID=3052086 RepID=UPI00255C28BC|nr:polysaccharide biosynthesis protein [Propionimicrobium sp. PCR01-08-3]WIY83000.1 polysaccharide biosynthesis protein [Propionimicrobium sp. PCR01-08-3]
MFENKKLLITGGTGSFGNAVLRRFLESDIAEIRIFSRDEKKQDDMRKHYASDKLKFYIGDVRNLQAVREAVRGVDFVFHAAALKQVPSCEFFPMEAVRTNVIGTDNLLTAAIDEGVGRVVCLSTDKAAYPINAMGISKAMMEHVITAKSRTADPKRTVICCTRYGNVMASRGSVIPLFVDQLRAGEPLTVTDPEMTRFLMNLDEAVDLVVFAFEHGNTGDLFVQKAPASTIGTLAEAVKQLFAPEGEVRVIGHRHGEKMHETLMTEEELAKAEDMGHYFRVPADNRDLNYGKYVEEGEHIVERVSYTSENTERLDLQGTIDKLLTVDYVRQELAGVVGRQE